MDFNKIQHGNIQISGLASNPEFTDMIGQDSGLSYTKWKPADDAKLLVRFFSSAVLLSYASEQLRKPKVIQSDFIAIRLDEYNEYISEVGFERDTYGKIEVRGGEKVPTPQREEYLQRFPKAWAIYQKQYEQAIGTPLSELKGITLSEIYELSIYKINTVEALAGSNDRLYTPNGATPAFLDVRENGGTFLDLREQARKYIKENGELEAIVTAKLEAEKEAQELKELVAQLKAELSNVSITDKEKLDIHNTQVVLDERVTARVKAEKSKIIT